MVAMSARARAARRGDGPLPSEPEEADPSIGHNQPPIARPILGDDPEIWREWLNAIFADADARRAALLPSFQRFSDGFPLQHGPAGEPPIGIGKWNDDVQGRAGDLKDKLAALKKEAENLHSLEKAPVLAAGKAIDGYKNVFLAAIETAIRVINDRRTLFALHKEEVGRLARQAEAERARQEAERVAAEARQSLDPEALQDAADAASVAAAADDRAAAPAADLARVHGPMGSVSSLRTTWTFELVDMVQLARAVADGRVPASYLQLDEVRVRVAVRSEKVRDVPGLRIFEEKQVR